MCIRDSVCADYNDPDVLELMNSDLPVVTIDYVHHNCTAVSSNNIQGIEDLVKYIYQQGHRKIADVYKRQDFIREDYQVVITHSNGPQVGMIHTAMNEFCRCLLYTSKSKKS